MASRLLRDRPSRSPTDARVPAPGSERGRDPQALLRSSALGPPPSRAGPAAEPTVRGAAPQLPRPCRRDARGWQSPAFAPPVPTAPRGTARPGGKARRPEVAFLARATLGRRGSKRTRAGRWKRRSVRGSGRGAAPRGLCPGLAALRVLRGEAHPCWRPWSSSPGRSPAGCSYWGSCQANSPGRRPRRGWPSWDGHRAPSWDPVPAERVPVSSPSGRPVHARASLHGGGKDLGVRWQGNSREEGCRMGVWECWCSWLPDPCGAEHRLCTAAQLFSL